MLMRDLCYKCVPYRFGIIADDGLGTDSLRANTL